MKKFKNILGRFGSKSEMFLDPKSHSTAEEGYACPMKCEGNKIYTRTGNCPVCNMNLLAVENQNSNEHHSCC